MSWSKLCSGPLDPSLKFKALPSESANSSSKFVVPKLAPLASELDDNAEDDTVGSKNCASQSSQAQKVSQAKPDSITLKSGKKRPPSTKLQSKAKRSTRANKEATSEDDSSDSSKSSAPSESSQEMLGDHPQDPPIVPNKSPPVMKSSSQPIESVSIPVLQPFGSVSCEKTKNHKPTVEPSLSSINEAFKNPRLYETTRPPRVIEDPTAIYVPNWSISEGNTLKIV